ncbi:MAG: hypothetical protein WCH98_07690 [Verrucomicrobiota bacterium]
MSRSQVLDLYFIEARSKLIDVAAFLDRIELAGGDDDYRMRAFRDALIALVEAGGGARRAESVLMAFSDPTREPVGRAGGKASGAWRGEAE